MAKRNIIFTLLLFIIGNIAEAQDFDIYPRLKDDNIKMPKVYENTLFDEYQILSRDVRMMDMLYSAIVPGYVHFKARDIATGYGILGARLLGFSGLALNYYNMDRKGLNVNDILGSEHNTDKILFYSSLTLIVSSYLFDWIHGKYRLEKKQENIRYKYSIKLQMNSMSNNNNSLTPSLSLTYKF